jgi:hypothetical protein
MRSGTAIAQPRHTFRSISINPLSNRPRADACGFGDGLRRLPALDLSNNSLSTNRREMGILMNVHPVLRGTLKLRNLSFFGPGRMDNLLKAHISPKSSPYSALSRALFEGRIAIVTDVGRGMRWTQHAGRNHCADERRFADDEVVWS